MSQEPKSRQSDARNVNHSRFNSVNLNYSAQCSFRVKMKIFESSNEEYVPQPELFSIFPFINEEYHKCKYFKKPRFVYQLFPCCKIWDCCLYCHIDKVKTKHKVKKTARKSFCLKCKTENYGYCSLCRLNFESNQNFVIIASQCRFFEELPYIIKANCCNNIFCCYKCHNQTFDHKLDSIEEYYCICSNKIQISDEKCVKCQKKTRSKPNYHRIAYSCTFSRHNYLIMFYCCNNYYCCSDCHDLCENHKELKCTSRKLCLNCKNINYASSEKIYCQNCSNELR